MTAVRALPDLGHYERQAASLAETNPDLVNATLEHDGRSAKPRPTLLHRANCRSFATSQPDWHGGHLEVAQLLIDMDSVDYLPGISIFADTCPGRVRVRVEDRSPPTLHRSLIALLSSLFDADARRPR